VAGLRRQPAGSLQVRHRGRVVTADELVDAADPEQRLALAAGVAQGPVQLQRSLEQGQLGGILGGRRAGGGGGVLESRVQQQPARQRRVGFQRVQASFGVGQRAAVAAEHRLRVCRHGQCDRILSVHRRPPFPMPDG
jgi:hypothetical protein